MSRWNSSVNTSATKLKWAEKMVSDSWKLSPFHLLHSCIILRKFKRSEQSQTNGLLIDEMNFCIRYLYLAVSEMKKYEQMVVKNKLNFKLLITFRQHSWIKNLIFFSWLFVSCLVVGTYNFSISVNFNLRFHYLTKFSFFHYISCLMLYSISRNAS